MFLMLILADSTSWFTVVVYNQNLLQMMDFDKGAQVFMPM